VVPDVVEPAALDDAPLVVVPAPVALVVAPVEPGPEPVEGLVESVPHPTVIDAAETTTKPQHPVSACRRFTRILHM
jgi:hypothetical protein